MYILFKSAIFLDVIYEWPLIASKSKPNSTINCLETNDGDNNKTNITNPKLISNFANKYYTNIAGDILKKRKYLI